MKPSKHHRLEPVHYVLIWFALYVLCVALTSCGTTARTTRIDYQDCHFETINTLEDVREWVEWDIQEGYTDSLRGYTYIHNIDQVLNNINK